MLIKSKALRIAAVILVLGLWTFWVYRNGAVGTPRSDQFPIMEERGYYQSDWDYFRGMFHFDQTRHVLRDFIKEDGFLSRPGLMGSLAFLDIFFRHNLYVIGFVSLVCHALVAFSLYLLLLRFSGRWFSLLLALVFVTQYPGMEMVLWRNVSPLMLSPFFFTLGLVFVCRMSESRKLGFDAAGVAICFFLSTLFHETAIVALVLSGSFLFVVSRTKKDRDVFENVLPVICLVVLAAYLILNAGQLGAYASGSGGSGGPLGSRVSQFFRLPGLRGMGYVAGLALSVFFAPQIVNINYEFWADRLSDRGRWSLLQDSFALQVAGILFAVAVIFALVRVVRNYREGKKRAVSVAYVFSLFYFAALAAGLVFARMLTRGMAYLSGATYYFFMTNFFLTLMSGLLIGFLRETPRFPLRVKQIGSVLLVLFFVGQIVFSYGRIQSSLAKRVRFDNLTAAYTLEIAKTMEANQEYCYGGTVSKLVTENVPNILLYRYSCLDNSRTPLYAVEQTDGSIWLAKLERNQSKPLLMRYGRLVGSSLRFVEEPTGEPVTPISAMVLSEESFEPTVFEAEVQGGPIAGLVVGFKDINNFFFLIAHEFYFYLLEVRGGAHSPPLFPASQVFSPVRYELSLRRIGSEYCVFYNRNLISHIEGIRSFTGRIGLYDVEGKRGKPPVFTRLAVSDMETGYYFDPVIRLNLSR